MKITGGRGRDDFCTEYSSIYNIHPWDTVTEDGGGDEDGNDSVQRYQVGGINRH